MVKNISLHSLRGIAILLVLGYHAGIPGFGGGYIGVDIFFLLSGYLIALKISEIKDLKGIKSFYLKRAKKIYPPLLIALTVTLYVFWWLDGWNNTTLKYLEEAVATVLGFVNVGFASYASAADYTTSPFLHLWSIALEIQFYIFAPLLAYFIHRSPKINGIRLVSILAGLSLFAFIAMSYYDNLFAYYSSLGRIWEFCLGALIYFAGRKLYQNIRLTVPRLLSLAAAAIVGFYVLTFGSPLVTNPLYGLLPIFASAYLIWISTQEDSQEMGNGKFAKVGRVANRFLGSAADISYPLYLIHYPVLFFAYQYYPSSMLVALTFSILAAYVIHVVIEKPIMTNRKRG